jgi:hypothetical protein
MDVVWTLPTCDTVLRGVDRQNFPRASWLNLLAGPCSDEESSNYFGFTGVDGLASRSLASPHVTAS